MLSSDVHKLSHLDVHILLICQRLKIAGLLTSKGNLAPWKNSRKLVSG
jgi:hypothetical protein